MHEARADRRKLAALTAIVQTMILERYWERDEERAKRRFLRMAEADHPVAMAIVDVLSEEELDSAFRWPGGTARDGAQGLAATPVLGFLTEAQYERARVAAVAEDAAEQAQWLVAETPGRTNAVPGHIEGAEDRFVSAMFEDLVERRGETAQASAKGAVDERVEAMPEPWRSLTRRELERLRKDAAGASGRASRRRPGSSRG